MKLLFPIFLAISFSSCFSQKRILTFINESGFKIDSLRIGVASADVYSNKYTNIDKTESIITKIPADRPISNKHDITIFITIYIKNQPLIYNYNYSDLGGRLIDDYTIILNKEKEVKWIMNSTIGRY